MVRSITDRQKLIFKRLLFLWSLWIQNRFSQHLISIPTLIFAALSYNTVKEFYWIIFIKILLLFIQINWRGSLLIWLFTLLPHTTSFSFESAMHISTNLLFLLVFIIGLDGIIYVNVIIIAICSNNFILNSGMPFLQIMNIVFIVFFTEASLLLYTWFLLELFSWKILFLFLFFLVIHVWITSIQFRRYLEFFPIGITVASKSVDFFFVFWTQSNILRPIFTLDNLLPIISLIVVHLFYYYFFFLSKIIKN